MEVTLTVAWLFSLDNCLPEKKLRWISLFSQQLGAAK